MLTLLEKKELRDMLRAGRTTDVSRQLPKKEFWRLREDRGRFRSLNGLSQEEFQSELFKTREIKLVWQKDTYGSYWVEKSG
ncbi:hypothetical protein ABEU95_14185 [Heyndrickxia faecalis]|uniref:hypothetical protein n=1 Tax=Heyndrickxia TaxID=2837504 RepID=UPI002E20570A|nr:hypothetical protein [Weizmannia sp. CD-2023]